MHSTQPHPYDPGGVVMAPLYLQGLYAAEHDCSVTSAQRAGNQAACEAVFENQPGDAGALAMITMRQCRQNPAQEHVNSQLTRITEDCKIGAADQPNNLEATQVHHPCQRPCHPHPAQMHRT